MTAAVLWPQRQLDDVVSFPCRTDPDLFFSDTPQDVADAKTICFGCPARHACLEYAATRGVPFGVWGGTSPDERRTAALRITDEPAVAPAAPAKDATVAAHKQQRITRYAALRRGGLSIRRAASQLGFSHRTGYEYERILRDRGEQLPAPAREHPWRSTDAIPPAHRSKKRCSACRAIKPVSEFHKHAAAPDGVRSACKVCFLARQKELRNRTRTEVAA